MKKKPKSHVILACLACVVLYYVLDLSRSGRAFVDYTVIGLVLTAIGWNLVQLGRRLQSAGGAGTRGTSCARSSSGSSG